MYVGLLECMENNLSKSGCVGIYYTYMLLK